MWSKKDDVVNMVVVNEKSLIKLQRYIKNLYGLEKNLKVIRDEVISESDKEIITGTINIMKAIRKQAKNVYMEVI